jgi:fructose-bisphosphate aldolase class II
MFVNTKEMFRKAYEEGYVVPAFNFVSLEQLLAIVEACIECSSPFILQASANVCKYIGETMVRHMAVASVEMMQSSGKDIPMALHLDHGVTFEECRMAIENGFSSVMIDGSALPYEENVSLTAKVVDYAHQFDITVEGELGVLSGVEDDVVHAESRFTDPDMVADFVEKTGVDNLAISIGTSHGVTKFRVKEGEPPPSLRFDILEAVQERLPGFPIVLHGASAILPVYVDMLTRYGGGLKDAQGIPEDQIKQLTRTAVCKINIASDGWIAMTAAVRKILSEKPGIIDPRKYLKPARREMKQVYIRKMKEVFRSADKALMREQILS